jgi:hypothetical protein
MESYRIRVKIGDSEFDAEGPPEIVQSQFEAFKQLLTSMPPRNDTTVSQQVQQVPINQQVEQESEQPSFEKMFRVDGRVISLTALPANVVDAVLLTLFGQRTFRNNDSITGAEIKDGLIQSGYRLDRVDRFVDKLTADGLVIKIGIGKASRYRLTNQGMARAMTLAREVLATIP